MRKIYYYLLLLFAAVLFGCNSEQEIYTVDTVTDGMKLSVSKDTVSLSQAKMDEIALTFSWNAAQVRKNNGKITYYIKIGLASDEMAVGTKIKLTDSLYQYSNGLYQYSITHWGLNELVHNDLDVNYGVSAEIKAEIIAESEGDYYVKPELSTAEVVVSTFALAPVNLYLVGTANPDGSELNNGIKLTEVVSGKNFGNEYKWEGNLQVGTFKFVNSLVEDDGSWSKGASSTELIKNGTNSSSDVEFTITKAGWHSILLNKENKEIVYGYKGFSNIWGVGLGLGIPWSMPSSSVFEWNARNPSIFTLECTTQANQDFKLPYNSQTNGWSSPFLRPMVTNGNIWTDNRVQATASGYSPDLKWLITADQAGKCLLTIDTEHMTISLKKLE